LLLLRCLCWRS